VRAGLCAGLSNAAIAHELGIPLETVKCHVRRVLAHYQARNPDYLGGWVWDAYVQHGRSA